MLSFQTSPIVNIIDTVKTCPCCKDVLEESNEYYIKISCGHEFHYDCIYDAFEFNKKRGNNILECPYCRNSVKPLPEKEGFDYCPTIHNGMAYVPGVNTWSKKYKGNGCCVFQDKSQLYCNANANYGSSNYCFKHQNTVHKGNNYCIFMKKDNYCNLWSGSSNYCWKQHFRAIEDFFANQKL